MKKILCFGDSNTFGFNPKNGSRYNKNTRWTGILSSEFNIIEAGCNNRTGFFSNPAGREYTGYKILPEYIKQHTPDIVIIAIGINDLQFQYQATIKDIETGLNNTLEMVKDKKIILISPSNIKPIILKSFFAQMFDETSIEKSKQLETIYQQAAEQYNAMFINLNEVAEPSDIDGLHYTPEGHKLIAERIKQELLKIL